MIFVDTMGRDVSRFFDQKHDIENEKLMEEFIVGKLKKKVEVKPQKILTESEKQEEFLRIIEEEVSKFFPKDGEKTALPSNEAES